MSALASAGVYCGTAVLAFLVSLIIDLYVIPFIRRHK